MTELCLEELTKKLEVECGFSDGSISLLLDKGFEVENFADLYDAMELPDESFAERQAKKSKLEVRLDRLYSSEITMGRYARYVTEFNEISSEQALIKGRMKFAIEYVIALGEELVGEESKIENCQLIDRNFTDEEKIKLRSIYGNFRTKDADAVKSIEKKTKHDIVAVNTWVTIRAQQEGLDDDLMRRVIHFARTSADVNTNVTGELYSRAIGQWNKSIVKLLDVLKGNAEKYKNLVCVAQTHGQDAQLTTMGHIYANLAEQIKLQAKPLLQENILKIDGKIAGAIGTDVDMKAAFPEINFNKMYKEIVEDKFGLGYVKLGNDQDCSNASLAVALDTMANVGKIVQKTANDVWYYASRGVLAKKTEKGESGSSLMPQKANPFLAEGAEALVKIYSGVVEPIKELLIAYRTQGDLRRSITKREGFHPVMLATIAVERLISEIDHYISNIVVIENEIYEQGPKIISSALNTELRGKGVSDAYDSIKSIVMKPFVKPEDVLNYVNKMVDQGELENEQAGNLFEKIRSVMDVDNLMGQFRSAQGDGGRFAVVEHMEIYNHNESRMGLIGDAIESTDTMITNIQDTKEKLLRYVN